ncbi:hypothetical protein BU25DRAFT_449644 [Macroventuria anomochaeta]|uniref:Uncharacterized protein n=1 Tax=Macroventuria anomochaeta TaxID=301207 RepID=A0ACB6RVH6_9PLEO|nr:uncharacterized protein BU25DRAFT_449644 [Macroventuria anomochaeta]KAF2625916.1 hypothetical protein BU25DRAFT_449644 [Macroventuria anomochaeta]
MWYSSGAVEARSDRASRGPHDHVDIRNKASSQAHSSAPIAQVLNDSVSSSHTFQSPSGRQTPQHAAFGIRKDGPISGPTAISPDARRRDEHHNSVGYSGGDASLIQLPKPPQVPRKTAKRPRIPPLLQGLHQPPPLPPKNRLFPPITSDRSGIVSDVGDRFNLGSTFPTSGTEELAKPRVPQRKGNEVESNHVGQTTTALSHREGLQEHEWSTEFTADSLPVAQTTSRVQSKVKAPRKRTRWSQKETEDLLIGVSRFGIGRWKQILECTEFHFQARTAVDLKDRFRICRPGEGLKARKAAIPEGSTTAKPTETGDPVSHASLAPIEDVTVHPAPPIQRTTSEETNLIDQAATSKPEIHGPFLKSKRRARREFSDTDDKNLLKGFKRHGAVWHSMRDDFELGFGMRHPTDLRDRFRIRYPDLFAQAGYKLKPKEERALKDRAEVIKAQGARASRHPTTTTVTTSDKNDKLTAHTLVTITPNVPSVTTLMPVATTSQAESLRPTFDPITDLTFDDDEGDRSPIVLNRNILQWADENSAALPSTTAVSANTQATTHVASDLLYNPFTASDGLHINPLATLKLPSTAHWSYMNPSTAAPPPSLPPPGPLKHSLPANSASTSTSRAQHDMRTPNLPNIVFPYVPNASARNAVHNLPAPADILSSGQTGTSDNHIWIG